MSDSAKSPPRRTTMFFCCALATLAAVGCEKGGQSPGASRQESRAVKDALSGDVLFQDVVSTLNSLPRYVNTDLRPPTIVLDASTSRDGKTVMAVLTDNPRKPTGRYDLLYATSRNSRFRRLEVVPGDQVRLFVMRDEYGKQSHVELVVQEVLDENTLRVAGGLTEPVLQPERVEIWRYDDKRIMDIVTRLRQYTARRPVLGWEPTPDEAALEQIVDRLNQWVRQRKPTTDWQLDPLVATLPEEMQQYATEKALDAAQFEAHEGRHLQEAVWLRDISNTTGGATLDDVPLAEQLFDWTVRNVQLQTRESLNGRYQEPWQALMYGRGTAEERAWVFALLARQQGLDVVVLALPGKEPDAPRFWLPALWSGGQLYLFDAELGLPIPGPDGKGVATLAQVREDPQLLRRLDLDAEHPYPVTAEDLKQVTALVEGSPLALSRRAKLAEEKLAGDGKVILTSEPSKLAEALRESKQVADVRLWDLPYRARHEQLNREPAAQKIAVLEFQVFAWRPKLWKARMLHFQGQLEGEDSAKLLYRQNRPSDSEIDAAPLHEIEKEFIRLAKQHSSYWLGLLAYDNEEYPIALDFFQKRTLEATPNSPWTTGARYNLARTLEAQGKTAEAILLYESSESPQSHGDKLRARWLAAAESGEPTAEPAKSVESAKPAEPAKAAEPTPEPARAPAEPATP